MIVRTADQVKGTAADAKGEGFRSLRLLVRDDGMGFTVTETTIEPTMDAILWYKHHLEACYCIEGALEVEDLATGEVHAIRPGNLYALDAHDRHRLHALALTRLVCIFSPALTGDEVHDKDGSYRPPEDRS